MFHLRMASSFAEFCTLVTMIMIITHCHGNAERDPKGTYTRDGISPRILSPQLLGKEQDLQEISHNCSQGVLDLLVRKDGLIPALDAFGKPTPGILVGNTIWIGHFDECMAITDFKYCLVDLDVNITVDSNSSKALTVNWGVCVPVSCSEADVQNGLELLLDFFDLRWITVNDLYGSAAHCTDKNVAFSTIKRKESSEANLLSTPNSNGLTLDEKSRATPNHYGSTDMINILAEGDQGSKVGSGTSGDDGKSDPCVTVEDGKEVSTILRKA
ncbi:uncharacterized protein [Diadema setosum]|uniref:uncharacterized protein n=1 Tax=Diadema setosum TaxID=31175 RepID=UPI003B3A974A